MINSFRGHTASRRKSPDQRESGTQHSFGD
jgi:hypothetical protein